jgi:hypothetical protein
LDPKKIVIYDLFDWRERLDSFFYIFFENSRSGLVDSLADNCRALKTQNSGWVDGGPFLV